MKKYVCILLAGVLLLSLTACKKAEKQTDETKQTEATQTTTPPAETCHTYTLTPAADDPGAKNLTVTDAVTQKEIQTIRLSGNEWFIPEPIYTDITFDGHKDILVPAQRPASGAFFAGYIWNEAQGQYLYAPSLESIPNIAPDTENKLLLSCRTASLITSYSMYSYRVDKLDFVCIRSLYWEPGDRAVSVVESQFADGKETQIKRFSVPAADGLQLPAKGHTDMVPYYEAGSLWDLDSEKWRNWVYTP